MIIRPSGAARRIQCTASVAMEARYPEPDSPEALDGQASHWAAACLLTIGAPTPEVGHTAPNGVILTQEMLLGARLFADHVKATLGQDWHLRAFVERTIPIPSVHPQCQGTPDVYAWVNGPGGRLVLHVFDYKFGFRYVEVFQNPQCVDYVAGALDEVKGRISDLEVDVVVHIVQPRSYHRDGSIRKWSMSAGDLRAHINVSSNAAHEALGPSPRFRVGEECRDCSARHACPELQSKGYAAASLARMTQPLELPPAALALELRMLQDAQHLLKARIEGLLGQAEGLIVQGQRVPGYIREQGQGREYFTVPAAQVIALGSLMGKDLAKPQETITPRQARELGMDPALLAPIVERRPGKFEVQRIDDADLAKIFSAHY